MKTKKLDKSIFIATLFTVLHVGFVFLNGTYFKIENVVLGVIQELTTIPAILLQIALFLFALSRFVRSKFKVMGYSFLSMILLTSSLILIVKSFIN